MNRITRYRRSVQTIIVIFFCVFFAATCIDKNKGVEAKDNNAGMPATAISATKVTRQQFAGSASCANCHQRIYDLHLHTAHFLTTRPASEDVIKGSFRPGKNSFAYSEDMVVVMEKRDSGLYQVGYYNGVEKIARRFDMVVGSGTKGQTYLSSSNGHLYQLPVSYFTAAKEWANSPLFPIHPVVFNRPITSRCLECHSTFAQKISPHNQEPEQFDKQQMIYGVDCEKCHGPAAEHVLFQTRNPGVKTAKYIVNPARLSRQQNLDICALCHGGRLQKTQPSFSFVAGDTLARYFNLNMDNIPPSPDNIDVHGNQYGLLRASACFRMSKTMTCNTCHNSHMNERGMTALFSQRCMTCHNSGTGDFCTVSHVPRAILVQNCIDCHMPLQASRSITELLPGDKTPTAAMIRSHFISIYPGTTKRDPKE
jgi:nitrate/TMAO reductase-like tetraheme cytochrome c subunit